MLLIQQLLRYVCDSFHKYQARQVGKTENRSSLTLRLAFKPGCLFAARLAQHDTSCRPHALKLPNRTYLGDEGAKTNVVSRPIIKKNPQEWQLKPGSSRVFLWGSKIWVYRGSMRQISNTVDVEDSMSVLA